MKTRRDLIRNSLILVFIIVLGTSFFYIANKYKSGADENINYSKDFGIVLKENSQTDKIVDLGVKNTLFSHPLEWKGYDEDPSNCYLIINSTSGLLAVNNKSILTLSTGFGWSKVNDSNGLYDPLKISSPKEEFLNQYIDFVKNSFINIGENTTYISLGNKIDDQNQSSISGDNWVQIYTRLGDNFNRNNKLLAVGGVDLNSLVLFRVYDLYQSGYSEEGFQLAKLVFENSNNEYYRNLISGTDKITFFTKIINDTKSKFIIDVVGKVFSDTNRNYYQAVIVYNYDNYANFISFKTALNEANKIINPANKTSKEVIYIKSNGVMANDISKSEDQLAFNMIKDVSTILSKNSSKNIIWDLLKDKTDSSNEYDYKNGLLAENGRKKPIYYAYKNMNNFLSGKLFDSIVKETNDSVIYKFTDNNEDVWVGWSKTNESFSIATNADNLKSANLLDDNARTTGQSLTKNGYLYNISLTSTPIIIFGDKNSSSALTADITAVPTQIRKGQSVALAWSSAGAGNASLKVCQNITLNNCSDAFGAIAQSGSRIIQPQQTETYLIEITDGITTVSDSVTITVTPDLVTTTTQPDLTTTTQLSTTTTTKISPPPPPGQTTTTQVVVLTTSSSNPNSSSTTRQLTTSTTKSSTTTTSPDIIIIGNLTTSSTTSPNKNIITSTTTTIPSYYIGNEDLDKIDIVYQDDNNSLQLPEQQENVLTRLVGTGKEKNRNIFIIIGIIIISIITIFVIKKNRKRT